MYFSLSFSCCYFPVSLLPPELPLTPSSSLIPPEPHFSFLVSLPPVNAGLPLNIAALMPMLMVHFDEPDDFCVGCAQTLSKVQWSALDVWHRNDTPHLHAWTHTCTQMFSFTHYIDTQSCTTAYSKCIGTCRESTTLYVLVVNCVTQRSTWVSIKAFIVVMGERFPTDRVLVKTDSVATFIWVLKCMQLVSSAVVDWFVIPYVS